MIKEDTKTLLKFNAEGIHPGEMYFNARQEAVKAVEGVNKVKVDLVWDPPWDMSRMSDVARLELDMM